MYAMAERLFPICRSLTGDGFRQSLEMIRETVPEIQVFEVPTGTQVFDWTVPKEWNIRGGAHPPDGESGRTAPACLYTTRPARLDSLCHFLL